MLVTTNILLSYNAPDEIIEYFESKYPDGIELEELFDNEEKLELLHFVVKYLKISEQEKSKYNIRCKITDSENVYNSQLINGSRYIVNSVEVNYSELVHESQSIYYSKFIYNSSEVKDSVDVWESNGVYDSNKIMLSENIFDSEDIIYSQDVSWSQVINNSQNIEGAKAIYKSNNITNSFFCGFCNDLENSLFCLGIDGKNYQIFNKEVSPAVFERVREELLSKLLHEEFNFISVNAAGYYPEDRYKTSVRFDHMFENLSSEFYGWISTLPNYSEDIFLSLFFRRK